MSKIAKTMQSKIDKLFNLMTQAARNWVEAGKLLVQMIEDDPDVFDKIIEQRPTISVNELLALEMIGHGLNPEAVLSNAPGVKRAMGLPRLQMLKALNEPVTILSKRGNEYITERKPIDALTRAEAEQAIDLNRGVIRDTDEQRKHVAEQKKPDPPRYIVIGEKVRWYVDPTFAEMEEIVASHKRKSVANLQGEMQKRQVAV